jgi:hypothetical protein
MEKSKVKEKRRKAKVEKSETFKMTRGEGWGKNKCRISPGAFHRPRYLINPNPPCCE